MTAPPKRGQWISLGMLIGGRPSYEKAFPDTPRVRPPAGPEPATANDSGDDWDIMHAAGYSPNGPHPGSRSLPWDSTCETCGQPRRPTIEEAERGVKCTHKGTWRAVSPR